MVRELLSPEKPARVMPARVRTRPLYLCDCCRSVRNKFRPMREARSATLSTTYSTRKVARHARATSTIYTSPPIAVEKKEHGASVLAFFHVYCSCNREHTRRRQQRCMRNCATFFFFLLHNFPFSSSGVSYTMYVRSFGAPSK